MITCKLQQNQAGLLISVTGGLPITFLSVSYFTSSEIFTLTAVKKKKKKELFIVTELALCISHVKLPQQNATDGGA